MTRLAGPSGGEPRAASSEAVPLGLRTREPDAAQWPFAPYCRPGWRQGDGQGVTGATRPPDARSCG